ncbi:MAG: sugar nucleotide-binding protein [Pseudohongiellaceae bacterium]
MTEKCDVLVLGATGMLGNTVLRYFDSRAEYSVKGTNRGSSIPKGLSAVAHLMIGGVDTENHDSLVQLISKYRPSVVVNCVGLVKQLDASEDPLKCMPINSLLPHRLFQLCSSIHARLVHISTDCVFDGERGMYKETDWPNARDLYGRSSC